MWIDAHAHLYDVHAANLMHTVQTAEDAGVCCILNTAVSLATSHTVVQQSVAHTMLYAAVGISPFDVEHVENGWQAQLHELCGNSKVIAVGETGMDTTNPAYPALELQSRIFDEQLDIARSTNKPVVVHSRGCEQRVAAMCVSAGIKQVMFHCFTGTVADLRIILDAGYYVSFSGIATFKQNPLDDAIRYAPADRILIETDSPYLAPVPFRGTQNNPALVVWTGKKIASVKGISEEAIATQCACNFATLFGVAL
jgi:TatD DNase family protein